MKKHYMLFNFAVPVLVCLLACSPFSANATESIASVSSNLYTITSILARVMWAACIITGIILTLTAITQFQEHRRSPKLVPLGNPVTYFILGILTFSIPFLERIFNAEDANTGSQRRVSTNIDRGARSVGSGETGTKRSNSNRTKSLQNVDSTRQSGQRRN